MTDTPVISVVIPAYNAAWCVARAIDSVLAQTFRDFELIVVNDGSTDDTATVLSAYGDQLRILTQANGGLSSARNAGIHAARGDYIAFLDADDWWLVDKLARQIRLMESRPDLAFCSSAANIVDPAGKPQGRWDCGCDDQPPLDAIFSANAFVAGSGSAVLAKRHALEQAGDFDETLHSLEDIDMWMRLAAIGDYACIAEPLVVIMKRPDSMSRNLDVMRNAAITVMRRNRDLLPPDKRGAFWRHAYAGVLSDYAKWAWRADRRGQALRDLLVGLCVAPLSRGRLMTGLLVAMLCNRTL